jgi:amino acid adenylation domain-containing protein
MNRALSASTLLPTGLKSKTIVDVLDHHANQRSTAPAVVRLDGNVEVDDRLDYQSLHRQARQVAAHLQREMDGPEGERVLLMLPYGVDYLVGYLGCLFAGAVAVPSHPPRQNQSLKRFHVVAEDAEASAVLTTPAVRDRIRDAVNDGVSSRLMHWFDVEDARSTSTSTYRRPPQSPSDLAFLQYTSGSTSAPKGVRITHRNLMANEAMIRQGFGHTTQKVRRGLSIGSWLPLYHDMGLIGTTLHPLYLGARAVMMSPTDFLRQPSRWMDMIDRFEIHTSGAPNFAYDLCVDRTTPEQRKTYDLRHWSVAFNGAEPVQADTLRRFAQAFAPSGFRTDAFLPCYGLAETTLYVTSTHWSRAPAVARVSTADLQRDRARLAHERTRVGEESPSPDEESIHEEEKVGETADTTEIVSCGTTEETGEVAIVDPETRRRCEDGEVGEIWVRGDGVADGYWNRPDATAEAFGAATRESARPRTDDGEGFFRTGDLGFVYNGELHVTGRRDDLIIVRGHNFYPRDIERTVEAAHEAIASHGSAAVPVDSPTGTKIGIVAEVTRHAYREIDDADVQDIAGVLREAVAEEFGLDVRTVALVKPYRLPKTTSGKVRRRACREGLETNRLDEIGRDTRPTQVEEAGEDRTSGAASIPPSPQAARQPSVSWPSSAGEGYVTHDRMRTCLRREAASVLGRPVDAVPTDASLPAIGIDSVKEVQLRHHVEEGAGIVLPDGFFFRPDQTIDDAASYLQDHLNEERSAPDASPESSLGPVANRLDEVEGSHPPSSSQRSLWFLHEMASDSSAYHVARAVRTDQPIDRAALEKAVRAVARRHAILRTTYRTAEDRTGSDPPEDSALDGASELEKESLEQVVRSSPAMEVTVTDATSWQDDRIKAQMESDSRSPFDLRNGPVARIQIYQCGGYDFLLWNFHHIAIDFWSTEILVREILKAYRSAVETGSSHASGFSSDGERQPLSYAAYARWQRKWLESEEAEKEAAYWEEALRESPQVLSLPTDHPRPAQQSFDGAVHEFYLSPAIAAGVSRLATSQNTTKYTVLLAAYAALLHRYSEQEDLLIGSPAAARQRAEFGRIVGNFVNPVVLRSQAGPAARFVDLINHLDARVRGARRNQQYPFPDLVDRLVENRDPSRHPFFQAFFTLHVPHVLAGTAPFALGVEGGALETEGLSLSSMPLPRRASQFDLSLALADTGDGLAATLEYDTALFQPSTIERMAAAWTRLVEAMIADPEQPVRSPSMMEADTQHSLLETVNDTSRPLDSDATLVERFRSTAGRTPDRVALTHPPSTDGDSSSANARTQQFTFRFLDEWSDRLAAALVRKGVGRESRVALWARRHPALVAATLGIWKAGAAYVPIDPDAPPARRRRAILDSNASLLLTPPGVSETNPTGGADVPVASTTELAATANPGDAPDSICTPAPEDLAYVLFTSGSTGVPKGVAVAHRGPANRVAWMDDVYAAADPDVVLQKTPLGFDVSVWEIFWPLSTSRRMVLAPPQAEKSPAALHRILQLERVEVAHFIPSVLDTFTDVAIGEPGTGASSLPALQVVVCSGEALAPATRDRFLQRMSSVLLENLYGPTEASVDVTRHSCVADGREPVPIGGAVPNVQTYVLDEHMNPVPPDVPGELYLAGVQLARGYVGRPKETASAFVPNPFNDEEPGTRLYRTGDRVRWRPTDGPAPATPASESFSAPQSVAVAAGWTIEFLGRVDRQVQVAGRRVEPGDVEAHLLQVDGVAQAAVTARDSASRGTELVGYAVPQEGTSLTSADLRRALEEQVEPPLVPARLGVVDELPRLPNGKVDYDALPPLNVEAPNDEEAGASPQGEAEQRLAEIWTDVLGIERIGRRQDFFHLGGHSLLAARMRSRVQAEFGVHLSLQEFFQATTIRDQALKVTEARARQANEDELEALLAEIESGTDSAETSPT